MHSLERNIGCFIANLPVLRGILKRRDQIHRKIHDYSFGRKQGHYILKDGLGGDSINTIDRITGNERVPKPANVVTAEKVAPRPGLFDVRDSDDAIPLRDLADTTRDTGIEVQHEYSIHREEAHRGERL